MSADDPTRAGNPAPGGGITVGTEFGGHRIEAEVGRGGMGVVYRARHIALDRERALKVIAPGLSSDPRFRDRFRRESRLAASIEHPNVIPVHHAGEEEGRLYIAMRLVDGTDLQREVSEHGPLEPARAAAIVEQAASALDASHAAGLVHRDVKPANVLLEGSPGSERVFLTDFGISRTTAGGATVTGTSEMLGSPDYVAPEQAEAGEADARSDIYSLAAVLYFVLTGRPPFERPGDMAKLYAHAHAPRPSATLAAPWLPSAIDEVVARGMAIDSADRYPSAAELAAAAAAALEGSASPPTGMRRPSGAEATPVTTRIRRPPAVFAAMVAAMVAAAAALLLLLGGDGDDDDPGEAGATQPRSVVDVEVGGPATGITVGEDAVWVAARDPGVLQRIDAGSDSSEPVAFGSGVAQSVAQGFGSVWAVVGAGNEVVRVEPGEEGEDRAPIRITVGDQPQDVAVGERFVWVANGGGDSVSRIDPETNRVDATVPVGDSPRAIALGEDDGVWVANIEDGTLSRIDPREAQTVGQPIEAGQRPSDVAVGGGAVWAMDNFTGTVQPIDPDAMRTDGPPIDVGAKPRGLKVGLGYVWVANGGDDEVVRIDPDARELAGSPIAVGDEPADVAIGRGEVWTANFGDATATRIVP